MIGEKLGPYQVIARLGAGGMGEVYRARDTRLGRDVAIKILPEAFLADPERLARFEREARVLASLNHPHIGSIYGVEEAGGVRALILELVDGETLADRIARGLLPLAEALSIARQVADALDAAHERAIVHRDLKPRNVALTRDGVVKVLDFGLAKFGAGGAGEAGGAGGGGEESDFTNSPTIASSGTRDGMILGTVAYMSPEQTRGGLVDKRADIWAFGCVIYEMLTARAPFARETTSDTIAAILEHEPDWAAIESAPPAVRRLLKRCLEKDQRRRLRDIADARSDIDDAIGGAALEPVPALPPSRAGRARHVAAGIAIGLAAAAVTSAVLGRATERPAPPDFSRIIRLTSGPAREMAPAISPDGKWVAYLSDAGGPVNVWVKFIAGGEAVNLTATSGLEISSGTGIGGLDISHDGSHIAVSARTRGSGSAFSTWEVPAPLPGVPRKILDNLLGARWSPDGQRLTFIKAGSASGDALFVADADGGNARQLIEARDGLHVHWPAWSPDGYIYFIRTFGTLSNLGAAEIYRIDPRGTAPMQPVVATVRRALFPFPMPDGRGLIYAANPTTAELRLWWQPPGGGEARPLANGVGEYAEPRTSTDGGTLVCTLYELRQSLMRISLTSGSAITTAITDGYTGDLDPIVSPVGDRIVFSSSREGGRHLWVARVDGSSARSLTAGPAFDEWPAFSPDGAQVAFVSDRNGAHGIWVVPADGGSPRKVIDAESTGGLTWSRDSRRIVYAAGVGAGPGLWSVAASGGMPERIQTPLFAAEPAWSPVRDVIAYMSIRRASGPSFTSVGFVDPAGRPLQESLPPAPGPNGFANGMVAWAPDGRRLAVTDQQANSPSRIWIVDPESASPYTKLVELPPGPRIRGIAWTHDGTALIVGKHDWTSDIVLMDQRR